MNDTPEDDIEVDLDADDGVEVELEEPEAKAEAKPDAGATEEDLAGYSDKVKKRINRLTYEKAEEKRKREVKEAELEEAITYAKTVHAEAERLRKVVEQGEPVLINQVKQRIESQLAIAQGKWQMAYEAGDSAALAQATTEVSRISAEKARIDATPTRKPGPEIAPPPAPRTPPTSDKASAWAARNPWFTADVAMQGYAVGVNNQLLSEGVDPNSDLFYTRIDSAVRQRFPEKFDAGESGERTPRRPASVVAPASRDTGSSPRKVTLTASEVAIAKRIGVSNEQYAAQKLKLKGTTNG